MAAAEGVWRAPGGGGGGTASLRVCTQNKTTDRGYVLPQPFLTALVSLQTPVFDSLKDNLLLLPRFTSNRLIFQLS